MSLDGPECRITAMQAQRIHDLEGECEALRSRLAEVERAARATLARFDRMGSLWGFADRDVMDALRAALSPSADANGSKEDK